MIRLWHLDVSHYNEKARWALDHKRIPHVRRAVMAGSQARVAKRLWGGTTVPVMKSPGLVANQSPKESQLSPAPKPGPSVAVPRAPRKREQCSLS